MFFSVFFLTQCTPMRRSSVPRRLRRSTPVCSACCTDDFCNGNCTQTTNNPTGQIIIGKNYSFSISVLEHKWVKTVTFIVNKSLWYTNEVARHWNAFQLGCILFGIFYDISNYNRLTDKDKIPNFFKEKSISLQVNQCIYQLYT
jgi:hypothetical protein